MTKQEFHEIATKHLKSIRDAFEEYMSQFPDSIRKGWNSNAQHLGATIWSDHINMMDLLGPYLVDGKAHNIYLVDYRDDWGEYHEYDNKPVYVEDFPNFQDLEPAPKYHNNQ